jgi:teichuronic acid biosynthesis glycosyltransferase TuaG
MTSDAPLVSVVMPVFNAALSLAVAIESLLEQRYQRWELILVDDGSTDESWLIASAFSDRDHRIQVFRQARNGGVAAARNFALDRCGGEYIAFLDADDQWLPDKLSRQVEFTRQTGSVVTFCSYLRVDERGRALGEVFPPNKVTYASMLTKNHVPMLTAMYNRSSFAEHRFEKVGHEDYVFWTRIIRAAGSALLVQPPEALAVYLVRGTSLSGNKWRAARWHWENLRRDFGLPLGSACMHFIQYAMVSLVSLGKQRLFAIRHQITKAPSSGSTHEL